MPSRVPAAISVAKLRPPEVSSVGSAAWGSPGSLTPALCRIGLSA